MNSYMVCDGNGDLLCDGLQDHNARRIAQEWADTLMVSVWLSERGDESEGEEFAPARAEGRT